MKQSTTRALTAKTATTTILRVALSLLFCVQLSSGRVWAQDTNSEYETTIRQALEEYRLGNYLEMYAAMRRAHAIEPNARTLRGMGIAAFELKDYVHALVNLRAALVDTRKPLTPQMQAELRDTIRRAAMYVDTLALKVTPPNAEVSVDGEAATFDEYGRLMLSLGKHQLRATYNGYAPTEQSVTVAGGDKNALTITLEVEGSHSQPAAAAAPTAATSPPSDSAGASQRTWAFIAFGGAAAFAVGTGITWAVGQSATDHYNSSACAGLRSKNCPDDADRAHLMQTLGIVGGAAAGALLVTGVLLLVTNHKPEREPSGASATGCTPGCTLGVLGVMCAGQF